ncbi:43838_t:CDS:2, partial [Gigaspora margarita]
GYTPGLEIGLGQDFGLANVLPENFKIYEFDGILGLAPYNEFEDQEDKFYTNIMLDFKDPYKIFSLKIGRDADKTESELTIGGIDQSKFTDRIGRINSGLSPIIMPLDDAHQIYQQIRNSTENKESFIYLVK